jgi:hypothetical protein
LMHRELRRRELVWRSIGVMKGELKRQMPAGR